MERDLNSSVVLPPRLIPTLVAGFNVVASHVYLILFPVLLDMFFWFGPLVRIKSLVQPAFEDTIRRMAEVYPADTLTLMEASKEVITQFLEHFNLLFTLRTFPVGIPSLMISIAPLNNPLGDLRVIEMANAGQTWMVIMVCLAVGLCLGCLFFSLVAKVVTDKKLAWNLKTYFSQLKNTFLLSLLLLGLTIFLSLPVILLISFLVSFLPSLGSILMLIVGVFLIWLLLPMIFGVHGIFMGQPDALKSLRNSMQLVRRFLPGTGLFLLVAVLLSQGLDMLWATPTSDNWMSLVGIFGHGFISTGVLAASFVYFFKGMEYMQEKIRRDSAKVELPVQNGN